MHGIMYGGLRTNLCTLTAVNALFKVNLSKEFLNHYGIVGAHLLALHAADAGDLTVLLGNSALFMIGTQDGIPCKYRNHFDDALGALGHANTTALAFFGDDMRQPVYHFYGTKWACMLT